MTASHSHWEPTADAMHKRATARRLFGRVLPVNGRGACLDTTIDGTRQLIDGYTGRSSAETRPHAAIDGMRQRVRSFGDRPGARRQ